ncbi:MAG: hypothetical protein ACRCXZ_04245 [Patescibacteria group bacterium]
MNSTRILVLGSFLATTLLVTSCSSQSNDEKAQELFSEVEMSLPVQASPEAKPQIVEDKSPKYLNFKGFKLRIVDSSTQIPPKKWGLVNKKGFVRDWINIGPQPTNLSKVVFKTPDLIFGRAEANTLFPEDWEASENLLNHNDPGRSKRKDRFGLVNTGFFSVNCFADRPTDSILRETCAAVFKKQGVTISQLVAMNKDQLREFYYKTKLPLILSVEYSNALRSNANYIIDQMSANGIHQESTTTSMYLFFIDQANQLGPGSPSNEDGAVRLIKIFDVLRGFKKADLLQKLQDSGIIGEDKIFYTGFGYPVNLNEVPDDFIRGSLARVIYHSTDISFEQFAKTPSKTNFKNFSSTDKWLYQAAGRWTFNSLKNDYPNIQKEINDELALTQKNLVPHTLSYEGVKKDGMIVVSVKQEDKVLLTKSYKPLAKTRSYTAQQVAFGDPLRRMAALPQSNEELELMISKTDAFVNKLLKFFGL